MRSTSEAACSRDTDREEEIPTGEILLTVRTATETGLTETEVRTETEAQTLTATEIRRRIPSKSFPTEAAETTILSPISDVGLLRRAETEGKIRSAANPFPGREGTETEIPRTAEVHPTITISFPDRLKI